MKEGVIFQLIIIALSSLCIIQIVVVYRIKKACRLLKGKLLVQTAIKNKIPDLVWFKAPDGKYLLCNQRFEELYGAKESEIIGKTDYDFVDKKFGDIFCEYDNKVIESGTLLVKEEEVIFASDGHKEILETIKTPVYDETGGLLGVLGIGRDITNRINSEEDSRKSEQMLQMVMNSIPQFIFWKDKNSVYLGCNDNFANAAGVGSPVNIVGKTDYDLPWEKEEADFFVKKDREVLKSKKALYHIIEEQKQADGKAAWLDTNKVPMFNKEGEIVGTLGTFEDITKRKQNELALKEAYEKNSKTSKELKKANKELLIALEEAQKSKELELANKQLKLLNEELSDKNNIINNQNSELQDTIQHLKETQSQLLQAEKMASLGILTAGVAHEINNPLNYINGGYLGLEKYLNGGEGISEEHVPVLLSSIKQGIERATKIVQGLNQFSRDNQDYNEDCDIHAIIDNCFLMMHNQFKHKIEVFKNYSDISVLVKGNVGKLHQVIVNLLTNSEQAINTEGWIKVLTEIINGAVIIKIIDNGSGIKEEDLKHITDPFFTTKSPGEGTGLGLSITHNIISEHNGKMVFESKPNNGTTVTITLPLIK